MGVFGTSNGTLMNTMQSNQQAQFKTLNNLLTLQENHVEDFFQYHGEAFLTALAQLIEDTVQKVLGQMLPQLKFQTDSAGVMNMHSDATTAFGTITEANINLDLQALLASAINSEVIMQRRMAKAQYLESQGFAMPAGEQASMQAPMNSYGGVPNAQGMDPSMIAGGSAAVGMNNTMMQQQMALNNQSGYPVPPAGYDNMNNPYWIDPNTGQMSYTPPASGLGLANAVSKGIAWAKWLA
jgi:hypothetical protein